jgi:hypothetical protein
MSAPDTLVRSGDGENYRDIDIAELNERAARAADVGNRVISSVNRGMYTSVGAAGLRTVPFQTGFISMRRETPPFQR